VKTVYADRKRSAFLDAYSDEELAAQGLFLSKTAMVDRLLRPRCVAGLAPAWAATLVDRLTRVFFDHRSHKNLYALAVRLLSREALALAAHVVLNTVLPELADGLGYETDLDSRLEYARRRDRAWDALEQLAWSNA
jgi:hypothetical protein